MTRLRLLVGGAFGCLTIVPPCVLPAQALIHGLVYDSLARRPLAGATLILQSLHRATVTDSAGRFTLDSVPPGRHAVFLADSELDAIGLPTILTTLEVPEAPAVNVVVAVPSVATLWRSVCGTEPMRADSGIVFGTIRDTDTGSLLAGIQVELAWPVLQLTAAKQVRVERRSANAWTDSAGSYRACGVATEVNVQAQAGDERSATGIVELMLAPRPIARQDFLIDRTGGVTAAPRRFRTLRGQVLSDAGRPIPSAVVVVEGQDSGMTDAEGRFALDHVAGGTQWLSVRATGYTPVARSADVRGSNTELAVSLQPIVLMDTITVVASTIPRAMQEFAERRRLGTGSSLEGDQIKKAANLESVFRQFPSLLVGPRVNPTPTLINGTPLPFSGEASDTRFPGSFAVYMSRGAMLGSYCLANLFIDGMEAVWDQIGSYKPQDIAGIEVYPLQSQVPLRFQKISSGCGVVLVWTRQLR